MNRNAKAANAELSPTQHCLQSTSDCRAYDPAGDLQGEGAYTAYAYHDTSINPPLFVEGSDTNDAIQIAGFWAVREAMAATRHEARGGSSAAKDDNIPSSGWMDDCREGKKECRKSNGAETCTKQYLCCVSLCLGAACKNELRKQSEVSK